MDDHCKMCNQDSKIEIIVQNLLQCLIIVHFTYTKYRPVFNVCGGTRLKLTTAKNFHL